VLEGSIVVIGDEILGGFVQDTNSHWLATRLQHHGIPLSRIHTVPDDMAAIGTALAAELERSRPRVVFTTGGIGSTPDDLTYEAVAAFLGVDLVEDDVLARRIDGALSWTRDLGIDVTDEFAWHMKRMARVPAGAALIQHGSWAPGLSIDVDGGSDGGGVTIVVLPGVPSQVRQIVSRAVEPDLLAGRNDPPVVRELTHGFPESALNLCFVDLIERYPDVKLGSYPGVPMLVRLCGPAPETDAAYADLRTYVDDLARDPAGARLVEAWADLMGAAERERR
jgi:molybdenum cofactor synthesis domain-containing protein